MNIPSNRKNIYLGSFDIANSEIIISDPSVQFDKKNWHREFLRTNAFIPNIKNGLWHSWINQHEYAKNDLRNAVLYAFHSSITNDQVLPNIPDNDWVKFEYFLGVDTAQICICDVNYYNIDNNWYAMITDITQKPPLHADVISHGVVTSSGLGDGIYYAYTLSVNDVIVGIKVIFINDADNVTKAKKGDSSFYHNKYLKYKTKYLALKNILE